MGQSGGRPSTDHDAVLIVDCGACVDPRLRDEEGRQEDGIREWTARFVLTDDGWLAENDNPSGGQSV